MPTHVGFVPGAGVGQGVQGWVLAGGDSFPAATPASHPQHPCVGLGSGRPPPGSCLSQAARACLHAKPGVIRGCCLLHQILMFH